MPETVEQTPDQAIYNRVLDFYWNSEDPKEKTKEDIAHDLVDDLVKLVLAKLSADRWGLELLQRVVGYGSVRDYLLGKDINLSDASTASTIKHLELALTKVKAQLKVEQEKTQEENA